MTLSGFIARRYFFGRKRMFAAFLSFVAIASVATGVFALLVVMSVMDGFSRDLREKLIGFSAHVIVTPIDSKQSFDDIIAFANDRVAASAEIIEGEGIVQGSGAQGITSQGVKIRGIDAVDRGKLAGVDWYVGETPAGEIASPERIKELETGIFVGSELAYQLGVNPEWGDSLELIVPFGRIGPTGEMMPEKKKFDVKGLFSSGYFDHDSKTVIVSKIAAEKLLGESFRRTLNLWLKDASSAPEFASLINEKFSAVSASSWDASNRKLFAALKLERFAMAMLLTLIVCVACISIVSVIFMYVFLRRKDVAVLSSCGLSRREISYIFIKIGAIVGLIGSGSGTFFALLVLGWLKFHPFALPSAYYLDHLPVEFSPLLVIAVAVTGVAISVVAAIVPAMQASKLEPRKLLRYE